MSAKIRLLAASLALLGAQAGAAVIDFNSLTGSGLVSSRGHSYSEGGFTLTKSGTQFEFGSIHAGDFRYSGTVSFFNNEINSVTTLSKAGGGAFDLDSIDLDSLNGGSNVLVTFTASLSGGGTATQSFTTDSSFPGLQTVSFGSAFDNVLSVSWAQVSPFHSFDNIVVDAGNSSQVPAPSALLLVGAALLAAGAIRRKA